MSPAGSKGNTSTAAAVQWTITQIGILIRRRTDLRWQSMMTLLRAQYTLDILEKIINREFTKLYHFLNFKKYIVFGYQVSKKTSLNYDRTPRGVIHVYSAFSRDTFENVDNHNVIELHWYYDWANEFDVEEVKHYSYNQFITKDK